MIDLEALARTAGATEQGIGHGGAYRELVATLDLESDARLGSLARFAAAVLEEAARVAESIGTDASQRKVAAAEIRALKPS
jgi:hypothetical protein